MSHPLALTPQERQRYIASGLIVPPALAPLPLNEPSAIRSLAETYLAMAVPESGALKKMAFDAGVRYEYLLSMIRRIRYERKNAA
jgi:hypothetical protein